MNMTTKGFLSQLLRRENIVPAISKGEECLICKEEYSARGSLFSTASPEVPIQLPCDPKHTVGSKCIAHWLRDHNTCPICRCEFFRADEKKKRRLEEMMEQLYVELESDSDGEMDEDCDDDDDDEDFRYNGGDTNSEDENMSDDGDDSADDDDDESMGDGE